MPDMHYFMRPINHRPGFELAKFDPDRSGAPIDVYIIRGRSCNCPSPYYPCKHIGMVQKLKGCPDGSYFDDISGEVVTLPWMEIEHAT